MSRTVMKCMCQCWNCQKPTHPKSKRSLETAPKSFCNTSCQIQWQNKETDFNKGKNNPSYRHGKRVGGRLAEYGDDFDKELKRTIKIRDGYNCNRCGKNFSGKLSKKLDIHHIDTDKFNNKPNNLVCLCKSCHTKVHWEELNKGRKI